MFGRATITLGIGPHSSFSSVCLSVYLFVCAEFFSAVFDPIRSNLDICYKSGSSCVP